VRINNHGLLWSTPHEKGIMIKRNCWDNDWTWVFCFRHRKWFYLWFTDRGDPIWMEERLNNVRRRSTCWFGFCKLSGYMWTSCITTLCEMLTRQASCNGSYPSCELLHAVSDRPSLRTLCEDDRHYLWIPLNLHLDLL